MNRGKAKRESTWRRKKDPPHRRPMKKRRQQGHPSPSLPPLDALPRANGMCRGVSQACGLLPGQAGGRILPEAYWFTWTIFTS